MQADWSKLFEEIDASNKTNDKVAALLNYLNAAPSEDKLWLIALFTGRKPKKPLNATEMRTWSALAVGIDTWLFEECYGVVGDIAETIALLFANKNTGETLQLSLTQVMQEMIMLAGLSADDKREFLNKRWLQLDKNTCFLYNKFLTGGFRIGVSQQLLVQALSKHLQKPSAEITHRLMGKWLPTQQTFEGLLLSDLAQQEDSKPYPFYLSYPIEGEVEGLGEIADWQAEWKWDGIRIQLIKRNDLAFLWSRGEELISENFPEIIAEASHLPNGTVIDGELLAFKNQEALPFNLLQKRITRKKPSSKMIEACPCAIIAYDVLEYAGADIRAQSLLQRRIVLEQVIAEKGLGLIQVSPVLETENWEVLAQLREESRLQKAEGLMLKRKSSSYQSGRKRGDWWKWKVNPMHIDAVLVYAQKGHGRRADLYTDYTFALWHDGKLQTFTKAYSGLTDKEMVEVDQFVKKNTLEKFGPVRTVTPQLVFEIGFEGVQESSRHKCGIALRFPRILRWRKDKPPEEANTLEELKKLI
jgi:DNA ligase-1